MDSNSNRKPVAKKYFCSMDKILGLEKHIFGRIWLGAAHLFGSYGIYLALSGNLPTTLVIFNILYGYFSGFGTVVGCHRFWAHKTFKAKLPLQILLAVMQTASAQLPIFKWCRDHRIHHKYVETDADPHDARRGFWFAHIGWLIQKEHPAVKEKEATIDFSDLDNDPVVRFQTKYYFPLQLLIVFLFPMYISKSIHPSLSPLELFSVNYVWCLTSLHITFLVNSAAHTWGFRPYEKSFLARENMFVAVLSTGEGFHNYHHVFPWDYKSAELGFYKYNWSKVMIDLFAWMGWAYDLKTVPEKVVMDRVRRTGDGSHNHHHPQTTKSETHELKAGDESMYKDVNLPPWGWDDVNISKEHVELTKIIKRVQSG